MPTPVGEHKLNPRNLVVACHLVDPFFLFLSTHQESLSAFIQHHCCIKILLSRLFARNAPCYDQYETPPSPSTTILFPFLTLSRDVYERLEVEKTRGRTSTTLK